MLVFLKTKTMNQNLQSYLSFPSNYPGITLELPSIFQMILNHTAP